MSAVRYVVGLGNPGARFDGTRHNLGYRVVDELARRRSVSVWREICRALVGDDDRLTLVKPLTFMNRSGYAVRCLVERSGDEPDDMLMVYDDVNLPFGTLRLRPAGQPGGHRGMESIVENLRTPSIPRLRLGIGAPPPGEDLSDYVLSPFAADENDVVETLVERAADAAEAWLEEGVETAMNRFNGPAVERR